MANNTIFDDVFQTIKEKMPELTIPLINEAFGTDYSLEKFLNLELIFPDERSMEYKVPILRMNWYSLKDLFQKQLVMLLPFYIIRYEALKEQLEKDDTLKQELFSEFETIANYLEELFLQNGQEKDFRDLIEIISKLANYIFSKSETIRKGLGEIMGGKVLELESDRLIKQGKEIGLEQGEDALSNLMKKLLDENRMDDLRRITVDKAYRKKLLQEMRDNPKQTA